MTISLFWKLAYRNLYRNGRRNLFTGTSIVFGLVGMGLLGSYILRMERYLAMQSIFLSGNGHVIVYAHDGLDRHASEPSKYSLPPAALEELKAFAAGDKRVDRSAPILRVGGLIHNGCDSFPFFATGIDPEISAWARSRPDVKSFVPELIAPATGVGFWQARASTQPINISPRLAGIIGREKVLGDPAAAASTADSAAVKCGTPEFESANKNSPEVQLVGAAFESGLAISDAAVAGHISTGMAFQDDTAVLMSYTAAQAMYQTDSATAFVFYLNRERDIKPFLKDLGAMLEAKKISADPFPFYDERVSAFYVGGMEFNWVMLYLFLTFVCSLAAISISNSLYISLLERKAELGTLRSLGFNQAQIRLLLCMESGFLFVGSVVPGLLLSWLAKHLIEGANIRLLIPGLANDIQFRMFLTPEYFSVLVLLLGVLIGITTYVGATRFLKRSLLDLLASPVC